MTTLEVETPHGPARVRLHPAADARAALVLGHGAGGGVEVPDLVAATEAALARGVSVALVEQPYRVAGRRSSPPPPRLDAAWTAVVDLLRERELAGLPLIVGGRSAGARVACRMAEATGAIAVLCLAFPLQPPPRRSATTGRRVVCPSLSRSACRPWSCRASGTGSGRRPTGRGATSSWSRAITASGLTRTR